MWPIFSFADCGTLSRQTPEVEEGKTVSFKFLPAVGNNTPEVLLQGNVTFFDGRKEVQNHRATETKAGQLYVYTISNAQPGSYYVYCQNGKWSNRVENRCNKQGNRTRYKPVDATTSK